jgi:hypothetical protein
METDKDKFVAAFLIFALIAVIAGPLLVIWALNTLFNLSIAYGFFEWLAGLILLGYFKTSPIQINKSK